MGTVGTYQDVATEMSKQEQALVDLMELAAKRNCTCSFCTTILASGEARCICSVLVDGYTVCHGKTWAKALERIQLQINRIHGFSKAVRHQQKCEVTS